MSGKILKIGVLSVLLIVCLWLAFLAQDYRSRESVLSQRLESVDSLLGSYEHRPLGLSCGVLSPDLASEILTDDRPVLLQESGQRTYTFGEYDSLSAWSDACLYERSDTKSQYVQLYITTYQSSEIAAAELRSKIPLVNEAEVLMQGESETTIYDAGVVYSAQDRRVIEVAAANGKPAEVKSHVVKIYDQIIGSLSSY